MLIQNESLRAIVILTHPGYAYYKVLKIQRVWIFIAWKMHCILSFIFIFFFNKKKIEKICAFFINTTLLRVWKKNSSATSDWHMWHIWHIWWLIFLGFFLFLHIKDTPNFNSLCQFVRQIKRWQTNKRQFFFIFFLLKLYVCS